MSAKKKLRGRAWIFGDFLDVDWEIIPFGLVMELEARGMDTDEELGKHCMEVVNPDFPKKVKKGDFIIAGEGMGLGQDHEFASRAIKGAGIGAVICDSTSWNFYKNSICLGLPIIEYKGVRERVKQGDELEVDLAAGIVKNLTTGEELKFPPYPHFLLEMVEVGGVYALLKKRRKVE